MPFALYRRPGGVVFLDDDSDYLEMLAEVMPQHWYVRLFSQPVDFMQVLQQEPSLWDADSWRQQEIIRRWHEGTPLIPQILEYWREDGTVRFSLTQVCVVDYSMPSMTGLSVLSEVGDWSGSRILLTGRADEQLGLSAFNRGLIEQFVSKQSPEIRLHLTDVIQNRLHFPEARHQQTWRATLSREQHTLLSDPVIAQELEHLALRQGWIEHVVIGSPFGVLALNRKGAVSWLQLELTEKLPQLAELADSQGWESRVVQDIRAGKRLLDLELKLALGAGHKSQPRQAFPILCERTGLHAALFPLDEAFNPGFMVSHERFIATLGERQLQH